MYTTKQAAGITQQRNACCRPASLEPRFTAVDEIVERLATAIQPIVGARIRVKVGSVDPRAVISADRSLMHQALAHLCLSARDAMLAGGVISIDARIINADQIRMASLARPSYTATPEHYVAIRFSDTGCSIPQNLRERLFTPFCTTQEIGNWTGVGHSTVYEIVLQHGGWIEFHSEFDVGTTFIINLPIVGAPPPAARPVARIEPNELIPARIIAILIAEV